MPLWQTRMRPYKKIVVSLGGNALGYTPKQQLENIRKAAASIAKMIAMGHEIVLCHGNGPQVGLIKEVFDQAHETAGTPFMPLAECGAMSQGYIGYHLQQSLNNELRRQGVAKDCVTLICETLVDPKDEAFENPCKPIGRYYDELSARELEQTKGFVFKKFDGKGYRRLVASPGPKRILQIGAIRKLMKDHVVICEGGGGIPVIEKNGRIQSIEAVIDKDLSSALAAKDLHADLLMILMEEDHVCLNFGKKDEVKLKDVRVRDLQRYLEQGQFPYGSMYPKVKACMDFVKGKKQAIITSLDQALDALEGDGGTHIRA